MMHPYDNPYDNRRAANGVIQLLSREKLLWRICSAIADRQNVAISGLPKLGKTYILKSLSSSKVQEWFKHQSERDFKKHIFVYIDLGLCLQKPTEEFFEILTRCVVEQCQGLLESIYKGGDGEEGFAKLLDQIHAQNFYPILLLDMFDEIGKKNDHMYEILANLRGHAGRERVSYVVASITPLPEICRSNIGGSPFYTIFDRFRLEALASEEARRLAEIPAKNAGLPFKEQEIALILRLAGRHPFFIQRVCYYAFEEKLSHGNMDEQRIEKLAYDDLLPHFNDMWEDLSEDRKAILERNTILQEETEKQGSQQRDLLELSESDLFRQFVRSIRGSKSFEITLKELEDALEKLDDAKALGETKLALLNIVARRQKNATISTVEKGIIIRTVLNEAFERLRGSLTRSDTNPALQSYNILYYRYFKNHLKNEQIAARIGFSTRQYYRYRKRAIDDLLNVLFEMEHTSLEFE